MDYLEWIFLKHESLNQEQSADWELYEEDDLLFHEILNLKILNDHEKELISE